MAIEVAHSTKSSVTDAVDDLKRELQTTDPVLILFFASSTFDPAALAKHVQRAFPKAQTIGCTTAGELVCAQMLKGSVVAMAFGPDVLARARVEILTGFDKDIDVRAAFDSFKTHFGIAMRDMPRDKYLGLVLTDGLSGAEERVMDKLGDTCNLVFIGGSAGDDQKFEATHVFANGQALQNASALAVLEPVVAFHVIKTQSFDVLPKKLVATRVDEMTRTVHEFDGKPAAEAYADALGVSVSELPSHFMSNPLGLMVGVDEPFVRSPQQVIGTAVKFYCSMIEGMELSLLQTRDIVADTKAVLERELGGRGEVAGLINFHCILRTLQLEKTGQTEAYGKIFTGIPTVGFSTYGESYIAHINQTSTIVVLHR